MKLHTIVEEPGRTRQEKLYNLTRDAAAVSRDRRAGRITADEADRIMAELRKERAKLLARR